MNKSKVHYIKEKVDFQKGYLTGNAAIQAVVLEQNKYIFAVFIYLSKRLFTWGDTSYLDGISKRSEILAK